MMRKNSEQQLRYQAEDGFIENSETNTAHAESAPGAENRAEVSIIVCPIQGKMCIHFCAIPLLQGGVNGDLWWPLTEGMELHKAVENIMVTNRIANNVTRLDLLMRQGKSTDYRVIFNKGLLY